MYKPVYLENNLKGAEFKIYADEDISTLDGTIRNKKGDLVSTIITDEQGVATSNLLYLGKYKIIETKSPYGMIENPTPQYVELTYAGQEVEVTSVETNIYNQRQKVEINLKKILEQDKEFFKWFYESIYNAVADFFTMMGNMGVEIFDIEWIKATILLFTLFGWALFIAGTVVAVFDVAIEYQNGRGDIKTTALNILKGFFACSLIGVAPVELYKFCISLQNTFSHDLSRIFAGQQSINLQGQSTSVLVGMFAVETQISFTLFNLLALIA